MASNAAVQDDDFSSSDRSFRECYTRPSHVWRGALVASINAQPRAPSDVPIKFCAVARQAILRINTKRQPITSLCAVLNMLVTHRRVPDLVVQDAVKVIATSCEELGRLNPLFANMQELFE